MFFITIPVYTKIVYTKRLAVAGLEGRWSLRGRAAAYNGRGGNSE